MFKKILILMMVVMLGTSLMAGCQKKDDQTTDSTTKSENQKEKTDTSKKDKKVNLRYMWWGGDARHEATLAAIKRYEELNENINIEPEYMGYSGYYDKLVTQLAGKTGPDVMQIDVPWLIDIMKQKDMLVNLYDQSIVNMESFDSGFLKSFCEFDGQLAGVPCGINAQTVFVNTKLFDEIGLEYDKQWTWDELLTEGEKLNDANPEQYLLNQNIEQVLTFVLKPYLYQLTGNQIVNMDKSYGFTQDDLVKTYTYIEDLYNRKVMQPASETILYQSANENPKWIEGQIGMQFEWPPTLYRYQYDATNIDVIPMPIIEGGKSTGVVMKATMLTSVNANSKNQEEALKFVNWLFNDEEAIAILGDVRGVPASKKAQDKLVADEKINALMVESVDNGLSNPFSAESALTNSSEVKTIFVEMIELIAYGEIGPDEAAKETIIRLDEAMK